MRTGVPGVWDAVALQIRKQTEIAAAKVKAEAEKAAANAAGGKRSRFVSGRVGREVDGKEGRGVGSEVVPPKPKLELRRQTARRSVR